MRSATPDLSLVAPCFNEAAGLANLVDALTRALAPSGIDYEIVLVDNGSRDATPEILATLRACDPRVRSVRVDVNRGYGLGVRTGLAAARGRIVGWIDGDHQVDPSAVVTLYNGLRDGRGDFGVARRVDREDGIRRKVASRAYNFLARALLGTGLADVNGKPKLFRAADLRRIDVVSDDWFVDTELVVKLRGLGLRPFAPEVPSLPRTSGRSNVRLGTVREFASHLFEMRRGRLRAGTPVVLRDEERSPLEVAR